MLTITKGALSVTSVCHVCQSGGMVRSTLEDLSPHPFCKQQFTVKYMNDVVQRAISRSQC